MSILNVPQIQILSFCWKQNIINSQQFGRRTASADSPVLDYFRWTCFLIAVDQCLLESAALLLGVVVFNQHFKGLIELLIIVYPFCVPNKNLGESVHLDWYTGHCNFWLHLGSHSQLQNSAGTLHPFFWNGLIHKDIKVLQEDTWTVHIKFLKMCVRARGE